MAVTVTRPRIRTAHHKHRATIATIAGYVPGWLAFAILGTPLWLALIVLALIAIAVWECL